MLNSSLEISSLKECDQKAFIGGVATKQMIVAGTLLYKFTEHPLYQSAVSPWWSFVDTVVPIGERLEDVLQRAGNLGVDPSQVARARGAVTQQWNSMSDLLISQLTQSAYGFVGRCAAQPMDKQYGQRVVWIGGAWQAYIPNLSAASIVQV